VCAVNAVKSVHEITGKAAERSVGITKDRTERTLELVRDDVRTTWDAYTELNGAKLVPNRVFDGIDHDGRWQCVKNFAHS
jgi:hypothetical protein